MEESKDYQWAEYVQLSRKGTLLEKFYSHTKTIERLEKEDLTKLIVVLKRILAEAAISRDQGGSINYDHMLNILYIEDMKP